MGMVTVAVLAAAVGSFVAGRARNPLMFLFGWGGYFFGLVWAVRQYVGAEAMDSVSNVPVTLVLAGFSLIGCVVALAVDWRLAEWFHRAPKSAGAAAHASSTPAGAAFVPPRAPKSPVKPPWGRRRFRPASRYAGYRRAGGA